MSIENIENKIDRLESKIDNLDGLKYDNLESKIELLGEQNSLKVGYVGHLYKGRGIETIIECAKQLSNVTFHLVGGIKQGY